MHKFPLAIWMLGWPAVWTFSEFSPHYKDPGSGVNFTFLAIWIVGSLLVNADAPKAVKRRLPKSIRVCLRRAKQKKVEAAGEVDGAAI